MTKPWSQFFHLHLACFIFLFVMEFFFPFYCITRGMKKISFTVFHCLPRKRLSKGNLSCDSIDTHCGSQMAFTRLKNYLNSQYFTKQMRCDTQTLDNFSQFQFLWYFFGWKNLSGIPWENENWLNDESSKSSTNQREAMSTVREKFSQDLHFVITNITMMSNRQITRFWVDLCEAVACRKWKRFWFLITAT